MISFNFSGGPRGFIGKNLALIETKIMVIKFMKRYSSMMEPVKRIVSDSPEPLSGQTRKRENEVQSSQRPQP